MSISLRYDSATTNREVRSPHFNSATTSTVDPRITEARVLLAGNAYLRHSQNYLTLAIEKDSLIIHGDIPSYYLKQVLQESLRPLALTIKNLTTVV